MQQSDEIMSYFLAVLKSALSIVTLFTLQYFAKPLLPVSPGHYRFSKGNWKQGLRHKICSVDKVIIWAMWIRRIKRKAANDKFLNDNDGIGKMFLKPDQSSKQTQLRYLALLNPSLILGKEGKLTIQEVVRNTRLGLVFVLVFVRHQVGLLGLGKRRKIKFQIKE